MLFRGTEHFGSEEIDQIFDAMGAEINAGTDKEATTLYTRVLDRHLERAFEVMSEMIWQPRFGELEHRARGRAGGDRDVRRRPPGPRVRHARQGDLRLASARSRGDRHGRRRRRRHARAAGGVPRPALPAREHRDRGSRVDRPRRARADGRSRDRRTRTDPQAPTARRSLGRRRRARRPRVAPRSRAISRGRRRDGPGLSPARALPGERHRAVPRVRRGRRDRARRRAPLRAAGARRRARRDILLAPVPGGARASRAGLLGVLLLEPVRPHRRGRAVRGHSPRQPQRGAGGPRGGARALRRGSRQRQRSWSARART